MENQQGLPDSKG